MLQHVENVNPQDWRKSAQLAARMPLQPAAGHFGSGSLAGGGASSGAAAVGTSSFGMSGVNAHALLSRPGGTAALTGPEPAQVLLSLMLSLNCSQDHR